MEGEGLHRRGVGEDGEGVGGGVGGGRRGGDLDCLCDVPIKVVCDVTVEGGVGGGARGVRRGSENRPEEGCLVFMVCGEFGVQCYVGCFASNGEEGYHGDVR